MKKAYRILAVILSVILVCGGILPAASAYVIDNDTVTILVDGINAADIISSDTGDTLFPPSSDTIVSAVMSAVPSALKSLVTDDWSYAEQPLIDAANSIFNPIACDENGKPYSTTAFDWEWPDEETLKLRLDSENYDTVRYAFDWRLDMKTIATDLHSFIEYVMGATGVSRVNLIGFSMGTCAVMSYLKLFDYEYVNGVVLLAGGYNGVSVCGQPFSEHVKLDADAIVRFVDCKMDDDTAGGVIVNSLLSALNAMGILDSVCDLGNEITAELSDAVYENVFAKTFATMPGIWSLVPAEYYDEAMSIIGSSLSDTTKEMISWYHDEVQANNREIIDGCFERGINFGIVAKYGYSGMPVMEATSNQCDGMIDTKYESFGATCAPVESTLGDNYTQAVDTGFDCVSPDNIIDASTCAYPEYTWFIKNSYHSDDLDAMTKLCMYILNAGEQVSVLSGGYSQYLIVSGDDLVTLDGETDTGAIYSDNIGNENIISVLTGFNSGWITVIKNKLLSIADSFRNLFRGALC